METVRIRDPGWKKVESGIRDKHPGSATLFLIFPSFHSLFSYFYRRARCLKNFFTSTDPRTISPPPRKGGIFQYEDPWKRVEACNTKH
jgi:hypothetical protein